MTLRLAKHTRKGSRSFLRSLTKVMKPVSVPKIIKIKIPIIILKTPIFAEKAIIKKDFKSEYH